jgi:hypothetical protein
MRQLAFAAVLLGLSVVPVAKGEVPLPRPAPSVERLIDQLGSRDFRTREAASRALGALGIEALPALRKGRSHSDPEVRRRLDELIPPLERAVTLMPRRVSLHVTNKPIREVIAEIGRQTGYKLATWPDGAANDERGKLLYTFHFDRLPFWEALDRVCEASGIVLQQNWGDEQLRLFFQDSYVPFTFYDGPFKVVATGFNYSRNNSFGQLPRHPAQQFQPGMQNFESLQVNFLIAVEPKLPIIRPGMVRLTEAVDEEGNSMLPPASAGGNNWAVSHYYGGYYRNYLHQTQANLLWPSKTSRTVKRIRGVVPVTLLADQKPTLITDKLLTSKGKKFTVGSATFHIEELTEMPGKQYQIKMSVTEDAKDNLQDYSRIQSLQQRLEVQDDKGQKEQFYFNMFNWNGPSHGQVTFTVQPSPGKAHPPSRLVYYSWSLLEHEVAFEFRNLPLP